jgi:copper chaperone
MERITMKIEGMTCGHCVASINNALKSIDGVQVDNVRVGSAAVAYDPARTSSEAIAQTIADEGYAVVSTENAASAPEAL